MNTTETTEAINAGLLALIDQLEDYIENYDGDVEDGDYNQAVGVISGLRYAINGRTDADLENLLANVRAR